MNKQERFLTEQGEIFDTMGVGFSADGEISDRMGRICDRMGERFLTEQREIFGKKHGEIFDQTRRDL